MEGELNFSAWTKIFSGLNACLLLPKRFCFNEREEDKSYFIALFKSIANAFVSQLLKKETHLIADQIMQNAARTFLKTFHSNSAVENQT